MDLINDTSQTKWEMGKTAPLGISQPAVSRLAQRGEKLAIENNLFLENKSKDIIV